MVVKLMISCAIGFFFAMFLEHKVYVLFKQEDSQETKKSADYEKEKVGE